jgi:hypothetical protein
MTGGRWAAVQAHPRAALKCEVPFDLTLNYVCLSLYVSRYYTKTDINQFKLVITRYSNVNYYYCYSVYLVLIYTRVYYFYPILSI